MNFFEGEGGERETAQKHFQCKVYLSIPYTIYRATHIQLQPVQLCHKHFSVLYKAKSQRS